jgi:hypothetical protein
MVNYEFLKSLDNDLFYEMVRRGVVSVHIMDWVTIYEFYLNELKSNSKSVAIVSTAEKYNCHENTIYNIIKFLQKPL